MVEYDIVYALRYLAKLHEDDLGSVPSLTLTKAADEIERLRHDLERAIANHSADLSG